MLASIRLRAHLASRDVYNPHLSPLTSHPHPHLSPLTLTSYLSPSPLTPHPHSHPGGAPRGQQLGDLRRGPQVVVATPGRLNDFLEMRQVTTTLDPSKPNDSWPGNPHHSLTHGQIAIGWMKPILLTYLTYLTYLLTYLPTSYLLTYLDCHRRHALLRDG